MAEHRAVRMGIDVGGTYTKCVAMDNLTHEIIGKNEVKTTHDDKDGVAAGVVQSFKNCMAENDIAPEDVVFVAHSTTQATNAFIEGEILRNPAQYHRVHRRFKTRPVGEAKLY